MRPVEPAQSRTSCPLLRQEAPLADVGSGQIRGKVNRRGSKTCTMGREQMSAPAAKRILEVGDLCRIPARASLQPSLDTVCSDMASRQVTVSSGKTYKPGEVDEPTFNFCQESSMRVAESRYTSIEPNIPYGVCATLPEFYDHILLFSYSPKITYSSAQHWTDFRCLFPGLKPQCRPVSTSDDHRPCNHPIVSTARPYTGSTQQLKAREANAVVTNCLTYSKGNREPCQQKAPQTA
ncbi:uncharacterized protein BJX67DRAFT_327196 [Aspergillus lucknowensis]|uniref:Uncharacterized protein n=1 Tax=Aspergillus lucknowensis TaxID=176173 RepID=A0ABR4L8E9_9EURO